MRGANSVKGCEGRCKRCEDTMVQEVQAVQGGTRDVRVGMRSVRGVTGARVGATGMRTG